MNNSLLYQEIIKNIEQSISEGVYKEGDKLPSERAMAMQYEVSRIVIREAIKVLHEKGLVLVKPGKGAYVTQPKDHIVTDTLRRVVQKYDSSLEDILEVREDLELAIIRKAVKKATPKDIKKLKDSYQKMESQRYMLHHYAEEDLRFHMILAQCTQNRIFYVFIHSFFELTEKLLINVTRFTNTVPEAQWHHWNLIEAIEARDEESAIQVMKEHMNLVRGEIKILKDMKLID